MTATPDIGIELCDAIVADLNGSGATWVAPFQASRGYSPRTDAELLSNNTVVEVYPAGDSRKVFERSGWEIKAVAAIALMQRITVGEGDGVDEFKDFALPDELMSLVGQLKSLFSREEGYGLELPSFGNLFVTEIDNEPAFIPEFLKQGFFASVITVTFQRVGP